MTALNKFKKFLSNIKEAAGKKLKDVFDKVKMYRSGSGNIVNSIKSWINIAKDIRDMKDVDSMKFKI
jgi:hypothetical protein